MRKQRDGQGDPHPPAPVWPPPPPPPRPWGASIDPLAGAYQRQFDHDHQYEEMKHRRRKRAQRSALAAIGGFVALIVACVVVVSVVAEESSVTITGQDVLVYTQDHIPDPPPTVLTPEATIPLGAPPPVSTSSAPFAFIGTQGNGQPVAWDPCKQIHYVVNHRHQPRNGQRYVEEAIAAISKATGLQFVADGDSDEAPNFEREAVQPSRYGDRWAPVLISWTDPDEVPQLNGPVLGITGPRGVNANSSGTLGVFVTGLVTLDGPELGGLGNAAIERSVIEHELGHLMGLDHVQDASQLMNPTTDGSITELQPGDLAGLAALGKGACFPNV